MWHGLLIVSLALCACVLALLASVALRGPDPLLGSHPGPEQAQPWRTVPGLHIVGEGDIVPTFTLPGLTGPGLTLPLTGRPVLLNYWASWCQPCRDELPLLSGFARGQGERGVRVVTVALDDPADAMAFKREAGFDLPTLIEAPSERDSSVRLGNLRSVLPYTVLIGPDGRLRKHRYGAFRDARDLQEWATSP